MPAYIDHPQLEISELSFVIAGWVAGHDPDLPIQVSVNRRTVPFRLHARPDVVSALPQYPFAIGFSSTFNLHDLQASDSIEIEIAYGLETDTKKCKIAASLKERAVEEISRAAENRQFCEQHLRCPVCSARRDALTFNGEVIRCNVCKASFDQETRALNMISQTLSIEANLSDSDNISSNPYTPTVMDLIQSTVSSNGWVLDCGAGSRAFRTKHVINVEIVDYRSTDLLAVGKSLPFDDNSFDAVVSLAVLEHVRDPFRCAKELTRVLKPGGILLADVPFLQPFHGYPHHYYNMTEQGLRNLFAKDMEIESCVTPLHGHPMFGVAWTLNQYRQGLPSPLQAGFDAMTVGDIIGLDVPQFLTTSLASELSMEAQTAIACLNTIRARKI